MLAFELLSWWYGRGWSRVVRYAGSMMKEIAAAFSLPLLIRTMFAPWRQIVTYPGASLDAQFRAFTDNTVSRAIGFFVRFFVVLTALIIAALVLVSGMVFTLIWPLVPLAVPALLIKGILG